MQDGINILLTIGGVVAFIFLAWRGIAWARYKWWSVNKSKSPAAVVAAAVFAGGTSSLAQRTDIAEGLALNTHEEFERQLEHIADLKEEEDLRKRLTATAVTRRRIRTTSALKADMQERWDAAGPMTTFITLKEAELAELKKAKAEQDKISATASASAGTSAGASAPN